MKQYLKVITGIVISVVIASILLFAFKLANSYVGRAIQTNSHQYVEGMNQRARVLNANIAEIDSLLLTNPENKESLLAQKRALSAQLKATVK